MKLDEEIFTTTSASNTVEDSAFDTRFQQFMQTLEGQVILISALVLALVIVFCYPLAQEIRRVFGQRYKYGQKKGVSKDCELPKTGPFGIQIS